MRVLICGSRNWSEIQPIELIVTALKTTFQDDLVIIHGAARGADTIAGNIAVSLRVKVEQFPAEWQKYGKKAGPLRNLRMLQEGKPDLVIAFSDDITNSRGTRHMCSIAAKSGLDVLVVSRYSTSIQPKGQPDE